MNDIIAGDPAPTNPTARENLASYADRYGYTDEVNALLDAYRAEVLAEAAGHIAYLLEATPEYGLWVADKLRAMAVAGGAR